MRDEYFQYLKTRNYPMCRPDVDLSQLNPILEDDETLLTLYQRFINDAAPQENPHIIVFSGGPGSGKTTFRKQQFSERGNLALREIDEVLTQLPGYQKELNETDALTAFNNWWRVALEITEAIFDFCLMNKLNIIYERTCGSIIALKALYSAKMSHGYQIEMNAFFVPEETAVARVQSRFENEGARIVSNEIINQHLTCFSALWPFYIKFIDSAKLYNNVSEDLKNGTELNPICVFSSEDGLIINSEEAYELFLEPGRAVPSELKAEIAALEIELFTPSEKKHSIGIIGHGNFGRFFATLLVESGFDVKAFDTEEAVQATIAETSGALPSTFDDVLQCDYVIAAIHAKVWIPILQALQGKLKEEAIVIGPFSMQEWPSMIANNYLPENQYFSFHAMFGPTSYARNGNSCDGLQMMVADETLPLPLQAFIEKGAVPLVMSPEEHDENSAYSLALHQFVGNLLLKFSLNQPAFRRFIEPNTENLDPRLLPLSEVCDSVEKNGVLILENLCLYNRYVDTVITRFIAALKEVQLEYLSQEDDSDNDAPCEFELLVYLGLALEKFNCEDKAIETSNYHRLKTFAQSMQTCSLVKTASLTQAIAVLIETAESLQTDCKAKLSQTGIWATKKIKANDDSSTSDDDICSKFTKAT